MLRAVTPNEAASSKESLLILETSKARRLKEQLVGKGHSVDNKQKGKHRQGSTKPLQHHSPGSYPVGSGGGRDGAMPRPTPLDTQQLPLLSRIFGSPAGTPQPSDLIVDKVRQRRWSWGRIWQWRKSNKHSQQVVVHAQGDGGGSAAAASSLAWSWRPFQAKDFIHHTEYQHAPHHHHPPANGSSRESGGSSSSSSSSINDRTNNTLALRPSTQLQQSHHHHHPSINQATTHTTLQTCHMCHHATGFNHTTSMYPHRADFVPGAAAGTGGGGRWPSTTHDKYGIGVVATVFFTFWNSQPEWFRFGMFIAFAVLMFMLLATLLVVACSLYKGMSVIGVVAYGVDDFVRGWSSLVQRLVRLFSGR